jgi:hypothetical protein
MVLYLTLFKIFGEVHEECRAKEPTSVVSARACRALGSVPFQRRCALWPPRRSRGRIGVTNHATGVSRKAIRLAGLSICLLDRRTGVCSRTSILGLVHVLSWGWAGRSWLVLDAPSE